MNFFDPLLLAGAAILTCTTGACLLGKISRNDSVCRSNSTTFAILLLVASLVATMVACSSLWHDPGIAFVVPVILIQLFATICGLKLLRGRFAWRCLTKGTVAAWVTWFTGRDGSISWSDAFLVGGLATWIAISLFQHWRNPHDASESVTGCDEELPIGKSPEA